MDIGNLAAPNNPDEQGKAYRFGLVSAQEVAAALREFAADLEAGLVIPQEARQITRIKTDEYLMRTLIIRYSEKL